MTEFNIREQRATTIQNIGRDMVVEGNFISAGTLVVELRGELSQLATEVGRLELPADQRRAVEEAPAASPAASRRPRPCFAMQERSSAAARPSWSRCSGSARCWGRPGTRCSPS
jgi:hypothetical protein